MCKSVNLLESQIVKSPASGKKSWSLLTVLGVLRANSCKVRLMKIRGTCALMFSWSHQRNSDTQAKISILKKYFSDSETIQFSFWLSHRGFCRMLNFNEMKDSFSEQLILCYTGSSSASSSWLTILTYRYWQTSGILHCQMIDWICSLFVNSYVFTELHRSDPCFLIHCHKCGMLNLTVFKRTEGRRAGLGALGRKLRSGRDKNLQVAIVYWY